MRHYNYETNDGFPVVIDAEDFDWRVRGKGATIAEACRQVPRGAHEQVDTTGPELAPAGQA